MRKILIFSLFVSLFALSGCSFGSTGPAKNTMANATVIKSEDGAVTWNSKIKINDKKTIAAVDVLSMDINPVDPNAIYIGTESNGLFVTKDGAESWQEVPFADKVYGLFFDPQNTEIMYGSGIFNKRAKIYKRFQEGQDWKEIYTEPSEDTTISTLALDETNPQTIYAGTSEGVILKTTDGGQTWSNLKKADGPIISIVFDKANSSHIYFGVFQVGVLETKDAGKTIENITGKFENAGSSLSVYTVVADPYLSGVAYVGTEKGIYRRSADEKWTEMNIIESSKTFPIRSIAINPKNSKEIIYSSAKAIYKSSDFGATWSTFQLDTVKEISLLRYDPLNPSKIYAGLRKF